MTKDVEKAAIDNRLPLPNEDEAIYLAKKSNLRNKVVPMTLIPLSSANGMLVMGSGMTEGDCYFELMEFLLVGGATSLSLVVLAVASQHMFDWIMQDRVITGVGRVLLLIIRWLGMALAFIQVALIVAGSILIFPQWPHVSFKRHDPNYCNEGAVIFSTFLLSMCWAFIAFATVCYVYIHCVEGQRITKHLPEFKCQK